MTYQGILSEFKLHVQSLSYSNRLRLIIAIGKDLFFDYKRFSETYQWGNPDLLLDSIAISEQSLITEIDIPKQGPFTWTQSFSELKKKATFRTQL
jgi:hypothetical protein